MPLILDNILVFLWRTIVHGIREFRCMKWPLTVGTIDNVACPDHEMYPYAEIHYCYKIGKEEYDARWVRGFWYSDSARELARRYRRLRSVRVRYMPGSPTKSYILDNDQAFR